MRKITLAVAALAITTFAASISPVKADSYYGPIRVGDMCWKKQGGNSLGYWERCKDASATSARAQANGQSRSSRQR